MMTRSIVTGLSLVLLTLSPACEVPHDYQRREFSAAPPATHAPFEVLVRFPAGGVSIEAGKGRLLYHAFVTHCTVHSSAGAELIEGGRQNPSRLTLSLLGKPGVFVGFGGERNHMDLSLSPEPPVILDLDLGEGESVLSLGGLKVRGLKLSAGAGDTRLIFATANPESPDQIQIDEPIGDLSIDWLGNANARHVDIQGGVGAIELDLAGQWRQDAVVTIRASVGDVMLRLPKGGPGIRLEAGSPWGDNLSVEGLTRHDKALYSDGYDAATPKLDIRIEAGIGELTVASSS